jgi:hypothetical protein
MAEKFDLRKSRVILAEKLNQQQPGDWRKVFSASAEWLADRIRETELDVIRHRTFRATDDDGSTGMLLRKAEASIVTLRRQHSLAIAVLQAQEWFQSEPEMAEAIWRWFGDTTAHVHAEDPKPPVSSR